MHPSNQNPASPARPRLLIVGGNSYVGAACHQALRRTLAVSVTTRNGAAGTISLDLLQTETFRYDTILPGDTLLFCAAVSSPDVCGNNPSLAHRVNVAGPAFFLRRALRQGARVIFLSSDTVIGPTEVSVDETATPNPHGHYARLKQELEDILLAESAAKILRLSLVVSLQDKFSAYLRQCLREGKTPSLLHPLYRNAIHLSDVITLTERLTTGWDHHSARLIHVAGPRCISRIGLAEQFFECVGYSGLYEVERPTAAFYEERPKKIALHSLYLRSILGRDPISIAAGYGMELNSN
jgi:dTDP-4-dehydrorhamnose reductase